MRRNIPSPQREINDLELPACFYYALKSVNLTVPKGDIQRRNPPATKELADKLQHNDKNEIELTIFKLGLLTTSLRGGAILVMYFKK
jgi:hypothetical protein